MIVIGTSSNHAAWQYFADTQKSGLDFVCWGSPGAPFHWLRSDNQAGGRLAAEQLLAQGRRPRPGMASPRSNPIWMQRAKRWWP